MTSLIRINQAYDKPVQKFWSMISLTRSLIRKSLEYDQSDHDSSKILYVNLCMGWGWGWGWLGPPLVSVLANTRAGSGSRGQPLHMTNYLHVLRSMP
jgi:hypothetical protein